MSEKITVLSAGERQKAFGTFTYEELGGGRIQIDPRWVEANLVECRLAKANGKGQEVLTRCHRRAKEPLERAFEEIAVRGLWKLIHSFDGLWVPRHMTWNPSRPLSSHSWGIAFDLNASSNSYGGLVSPENHALNEVFNRYGFAWGGDWNTSKDAMHWELAQVGAWKRASAPRPPRLVLAVEHGDSFSYHALLSGVWKDGHFAANTREVTQMLNSASNTKAVSSGEVPLRDALASLGAHIVQIGDHLSDRYDPRYYVFVRPANLFAGQREGVAP